VIGKFAYCLRRYIFVCVLSLIPSVVGAAAGSLRNCFASRASLACMCKRHTKVKSTCVKPRAIPGRWISRETRARAHDGKINQLSLVTCESRLSHHRSEVAVA